MGIKTGYPFLNDEQFIRLMWRCRFKKKLNLDTPETFNEKLQWLKLHDRNPDYVKMVDKAEAKKYAAAIIGEEYIIPTLGVWDNFDDIDFSILPQQFVLKCTHDSGGIYICKDKSKLDVKKAKKRLNKCLKRNYYYSTREWPYKNIRPRIIAEQFLSDQCNDVNEYLTDYKFMCFNGQVRCMFTCTERNKELKVTFFDRSWNKLPFTRHYPASDEDIPRPKQLEKMLHLAEILSKGFTFVRIDFYEVCGNIYFGEFTFYPGNGMEEFEPEIWDYRLGEWLVLPSYA